MSLTRIGDGQGWEFLNGVWSDGPEGELQPPDGADVQYMAVAHEGEYSDFTATFRFRMRAGYGVARLLFAVQDSTRYYALEVPFGGQQSRVRHFWAGLVVADGTPLQRYLAFNMVPGITARIDHWYDARLEVRGPRMQAWIDGILALDVTDDTYFAGRLGLMSIVSPGTMTTHYADLQVSGQTVGPTAWGGLTPPPKHHITTCAVVDPETFQSHPAIIKTQSGELIAEITYGDPNRAPKDDRDLHLWVKRISWVRSQDHGRTWSQPEPVPETLPGGMGIGGYNEAPFVKQDGTLVLVFSAGDKSPREALHTFESTDDGRTWTGPHPMEVIGDWPKEFTQPGKTAAYPLRLRDGTLLVYLYCRVEAPTYSQDWVFTAYVLRSTDDGQTWSAPVRTDRNNLDRDPWFYAGTMTETGWAEVDDGVVLGLSRPMQDPLMWRIESRDGGVTWEPASYAPFTGYCISLTHTSTGALLAVTRYPHLCAHVSWDGGRNWDQGTILDYPQWANHSAVEVEPGVVLIIYMGDITEPGRADTRVLRLRPTYAGLEIES